MQNDLQLHPGLRIMLARMRETYARIEAALAHIPDPPPASSTSNHPPSTIKQTDKPTYGPLDERNENYLQNVIEAFDRNRDFGPCSGMTRRQRYNRAVIFHQKYDDPPPPALIGDLIELDPAVGDFIYKY